MERVEARDLLADGGAESHVGHAKVDALADGVEVRGHELWLSGGADDGGRRTSVSTSLASIVLRADTKPMLLTA